MPKRPLEAASPSPVPERPTSRKNERSHEENQERAYIAASRRADRSLEARVQSAKMASEIHKKRTGKGFKITEEIVLREEMYEEEEDEFPRHMRAYAGQLQNTGPDMNSRVNAYLTSQLAIAKLAHYQEVDREFSKFYGPSGSVPFPAQGAQPGQFQSEFQHIYGYHPQDPSQQPQSFQFSGHPMNRERTQSVPNTRAPPSPYPPSPYPASPYPPSPYPPYGTYRQPSHGRRLSLGRRSSTRHSSLDAQMSTTDSTTPGSTASRTTTTPITNFSGEEGREKEFSSVPVDPSLAISTLPDAHTTSSFTYDMSSETKALIGADNGANEQLMSYLNMGELICSENHYAEPHDSPFHTFTQIPETVSKQEVPPNSFNIQEYQPQDSRIASLAQAESGTPNVDFAEWITDTPNF